VVVVVTSNVGWRGTGKNYYGEKENEKKTEEKRKGITYKIFNIMLNAHAIAPADGSRSRSGRCFESGLQ